MIKCLFLFEDDPDDVLLFREALKAVAPNVQLIVANSGDLGLRVLTTLEHMPDLIVMDINMPGISGLQCLIEIKGEEKTRSIPVVMFSTSAHAAVMREAYQKGASHYMVKPFNFNDLKKSIAQVVEINWDHGPIIL